MRIRERSERIYPISKINEAEQGKRHAPHTADESGGEVRVFLGLVAGLLGCDAFPFIKSYCAPGEESRIDVSQPIARYVKLDHRHIGSFPGVCTRVANFPLYPIYFIKDVIGGFRRGLILNNTTG